MKIESIKATPVTIPFTEPEIWSQGARKGVTAIVVQVITDQGLVGIGESVPAPSPSVTLAAIESAVEVLIGKDPRRIVQRWHDVQSQAGFVSFPYTGNAALAGIEMACWDILGKSLNAPVHALLGGRIRDQIPEGRRLLGRRKMRTHWSGRAGRRSHYFRLRTLRTWRSGVN